MAGENHSPPVERWFKSMNALLCRIRFMQGCLLNSEEILGLQNIGSRFDMTGLAYCVFNYPHNFFRIKGFFNKGHGIFYRMVTIDSTDNNDRYLF